MVKQISDFVTKSPAAAADLLLIRDVTSNTEKKTPISGIAAAVAPNLPAETVPKTSIERPHYNSLFYATGGASGGQVIGASSQTPAGFDASDTVNGLGVTVATGANAYLKTARDGLYALTTQWWAAGGVGGNSFILWWFISTDNGSTWNIFRESDRSISLDTAGPTYSRVEWLPANSRVRVDVYNGGNALRLGAPATSLASRMYSGSKLSMMEIR